MTDLSSTMGSTLAKISPSHAFSFSTKGQALDTWGMVDLEVNVSSKEQDIGYRVNISSCIVHNFNVSSLCRRRRAMLVDTH